MHKIEKFKTLQAVADFLNETGHELISVIDHGYLIEVLYREKRKAKK